jgi:hypothetical protein
LSNIIQQNISKNKQLDNEEVKRATKNLKRISNQEEKEVKREDIIFFKAVLMSSFINTLQSPQKENENEENGGNQENIYKPYECVIENCGSRFSDPEELKEHLNSHAGR